MTIADDSADDVGEDGPERDGSPADDSGLQDLALATALGSEERDYELWCRARRRFAAHAYPYLVLMAMEGDLHEAARRVCHGRGFGDIPDHALDRRNAQRLAVKMIRRAHRPFRETSIRRWSPERGPLPDYFMGCCLLQYPRAWRTLWGLPPPERASRTDALYDYEQLADDVVAIDQWCSDPGDIVPRRLWIRDVVARLRAMDEDVVHLAELKACGFSETQALDMFGAGSGLKSRAWRRRRDWGDIRGEEESDG